MDSAPTASRNPRALALDLAKMQALVLGAVFGGEILGRFMKFRVPETGGLALIVRPEYLKWYGLAIALGLNLLFIWAERKGQQRGTSRNEEVSRNDAIDVLYAELRQLMSRPQSAGGPEIEQRFARLRKLQQEEAAAMRQRYEARLPLKPGTGWQALSEARRLLSENENPPSTHSPVSS